MYEVEMKVKVLDIDGLYDKLNEIAKKQREYVKQDIYYRNDVNRIRVRSDEGVYVVNWKERKVREDVEIAVEHEFTISSFEEFKNFIILNDYIPLFEKTKIGTHFLYKDINLELSEVNDLGFFLEIEKLVDSDDAVDQARLDVLEVFDILGISRDRIEEKSYEEMILNK